MFLGVITLLPLLLIYGTFTKAFLYLKFYGWFILPLFTTLPVFTFWEWLAISLFISLFSAGQIGTSIKKEYTDQTTVWFKIIAGPWLILLVGWLFHLIL